MFLSLLFYRILKLPALAEESIPSFITLDVGNNGPNFDEHFNQQIDFTNDKIPTGTQRLQYEYFMCTVLINKGGFENNYAFGAGTSAGSGGAIFFSGCSVSIIGSLSEDSNGEQSPNAVFFEYNKATVGGALALLYSSVYITAIKVEHNLAYRYGGSIYFQGYERDSTETCYFLFQVKNSHFTSNNCHQIGGGLCFTTCYEAYFENCKFSENKAGITGGAFYFIDSFAKFFSCDFLKNEAGDNSLRNLNNSIFKFSGVSVGFAGRGGGAIAFISDDMPSTRHNNPRTLYTQECCFLSNQAIDGTSYQEADGAGHVMVFSGFCAWHSQSDYYDNHDNNAIGLVTKKMYSDSNYIIKQYDFPHNAACDEGWVGSQDLYPTVKISPTQVSFASGSSVSSGAITYIAAPTTFTYQATPITALPYKTTSSYKTYPTTSRYTQFPNTRTVHRTASSTPATTPVASDTTPYETPYETPYTTPFNTPYETPCTTPVPTRSISPTPSTVAVGIPSYTVVYTSYIYSYSMGSTVSWTYSVTSPGDSAVYVQSIVTSQIPTYTVGYSSVIAAYQTEMDTEEEKSNLIIIIASVVSLLILIIIVALLIWFFLGYSKSSSSSGSVYEMDEETILHIPDTSSQIISNDNPLWTTSVMGESDDPFRNDFEEVAAEGFFNERAHAIDSES